MTEYKIHLFNLAVAPLSGANPPAPHPKIETCSSLADARAVVDREAPNYEVIKIFAAGNDQAPVEEYRKGVRYIDGKRSSWNSVEFAKRVIFHTPPTSNDKTTTYAEEVCASEQVVMDPDTQSIVDVPSEKIKKANRKVNRFIEK